MPGIFRIPESLLEKEIQRLRSAGVKNVILFGVSHHKDPLGSDTWNPQGLVARMVREAKQASHGELLVIADLCFCEYTTHGHCGALDDRGAINNDLSVRHLGFQAVQAATAGADLVAPSSMLDGQVAGLREALDAEGFAELPIMSYSSKFASNFYGPFRDAGGTTLDGDRSTYMLDYRNGREALRESAEDVCQGADILMVKPGLLYLDVLARLREQTTLPLCVYNISGEYAMLKLAAQAGVLNEQKALHEILSAFRRAGADMIITYSAVDYLRWFN
jgi:porphobilinogen synthase